MLRLAVHAVHVGRARTSLGLRGRGLLCARICHSLLLPWNTWHVPPNRRRNTGWHQRQGPSRAPETTRTFEKARHDCDGARERETCDCHWFLHRHARMHCGYADIEPRSSSEHGVDVRHPLELFAPAEIHAPHNHALPRRGSHRMWEGWIRHRGGATHEPARLRGHPHRNQRHARGVAGCDGGESPRGRSTGQLAAVGGGDGSTARCAHPRVIHRTRPRRVALRGTTL